MKLNDVFARIVAVASRIAIDVPVSTSGGQIDRRHIGKARQSWTASKTADLRSVGITFMGFLIAFIIPLANLFSRHLLGHFRRLPAMRQRSQNGIEDHVQILADVFRKKSEDEKSILL